MSEPDQTLVPPEDDVSTSPQPGAVAPSGTVVSGELDEGPTRAAQPPVPAHGEPSPPLLGMSETVVGDEVDAGPTRALPALPPAAESPPPPSEERGVPVVELVLSAMLVLVVAGAWVVMNADVEPAPEPAPISREAVEPVPAPAPPPPPPPVVVAPPKTVERAGPVVLPSKPPPPGTVRVFSAPTAHVFVDGKDFGKEPVTLKLPAGRNTIVLENPDLALRRVVSIDVKPNAASEERFTFAKGWLRVAAPREAKLRVDGRPMPDREVEVWEGNHRVDIIHADKAGTHESQVAVVKAREITGVFFEPPRPKQR